MPNIENNQNSFNEVLSLIQKVKRQVYKQANTLLMELYWDVGHYVSDKTTNEKLSPVVRELPQDIKDVFKDTYVLELLGLQKRYKKKDDEVVNYALNRCQSPTVIADYDTELISKELYWLYEGESDER